jgi:hypothetical protein
VPNELGRLDGEANGSLGRATDRERFPAQEDRAASADTNWDLKSRTAMCRDDLQGIKSPELYR